MNEYGYINKSNQLLRTAIWKVFGKKCFYCGEMLNMHQLQIDHIIPQNSEELVENNEKIELLKYIDDINKAGFINNCIRNYLPSCGHCNRQKNNKYFTVANLRYFHEQTRIKYTKVIEEIEKMKYKKPDELECKKNDQLIKKKKWMDELNIKKAVIDGSGNTYYVYGLGKVRVDAFLPTNLKTQLSCLITFQQGGLCDCRFSFNEDEIINLFFDGNWINISLDRKFIWYIIGDDIALKFPHNRFVTDRETVEQLCEILYDLYVEYDKRKDRLINTVEGRNFEEVCTGNFKLMTVPKEIWAKMYEFAQNHDYYNNYDNEWNIFDPLNLSNRIRIYKNRTSDIKADVLAELTISNIDKNHVDIVWEQGYTPYIYDDMEGFDNIHKWTVEYTHDWILNKWIPYIFYQEELSKINWIRKKIYGEITFEEFKTLFNTDNYNIISYKINTN